MNIPISDLIYKDCIIKPFENYPGKIVAVNQSKKGTELQVRYFINGEYKLEWLYDFDIELKRTIDEAFNDYINNQIERSKNAN